MPQHAMRHAALRCRGRARSLIGAAHIEVACTSTTHELHKDGLELRLCHRRRAGASSSTPSLVRSWHWSRCWLTDRVLNEGFEEKEVTWTGSER
jgi:hypothetical protein